jgi:hypothetical protein
MKEPFLPNEPILKTGGWLEIHKADHEAFGFGAKT